MIIKLLDLPTKIIFSTSSDKDYLTDNPQRRCPDLSKSKEMLNYSPSVSLNEGLLNVYKYYKEENR
jgi:nucleoside-diphosphate-sugar epimerase